MHHFLGVGYEQTGRRAEAIAEYQKAVDMSGGDKDPTASLAYAYARQGRKPEAEKILFDMQHKPKGFPLTRWQPSTPGWAGRTPRWSYSGKRSSRETWAWFGFFPPTRVWIVSGPTPIPGLLTAGRRFSVSGWRGVSGRGDARMPSQAAEKLNSLKGTAFRPSVTDCNYSGFIDACKTNVPSVSFAADPTDALYQGPTFSLAIKSGKWRGL